jgi:hypothetical protein
MPFSLILMRGYLMRVSLANSVPKHSTEIDPAPKAARFANQPLVA